jgi:hypothetical protein
LNWLNIIIGLFLLFTGRGLFWLFVACVGFASGYHYAQQILAIHSALTVLIISLAAGGLGAILAIFFQKAAIVIAGFAAGGYVVLSLFGRFGGLPAQFAWLPYVIGGIIGAVILYFTFDWALIVLSTLTGATLIVQMVAFDPLVEMALFFVLMIAGMGIQAKIMAGERRGN